MTQAEQDKIESFNAHRRLKLPCTTYYFIGPNERILLRLDEEDLRETSKNFFDGTQLQSYQKKKYKYKRKKPRKKDREEIDEVSLREEREMLRIQAENYEREMEQQGRPWVWLPRI